LLRVCCVMHRAGHNVKASSSVRCNGGTRKVQQSYRHAEPRQLAPIVTLTLTF